MELTSTSEKSSKIRMPIRFAALAISAGGGSAAARTTWSLPVPLAYTIDFSPVRTGSPRAALVPVPSMKERK
ncbi:hypothetical protein BSFA1_21870 [Burkholderia sp. SFA1]|nr:hypothetical protein BSFA1_21870 [Burkholderia sp. SFA1]